VYYSIERQEMNENESSMRAHISICVYAYTALRGR